MQYCKFASILNLVTVIPSTQEKKIYMHMLGITVQLYMYMHYIKMCCSVYIHFICMYVYIKHICILYQYISIHADKHKYIVK